MKARGVKYELSTVIPLSNKHTDNRFEYDRKVRRRGLWNIMFSDKKSFILI